MTRIVAGEYGGRLLKAPAGATTRPTSDRTREALFASIEATHELADGPFVDLYAGSGAIGLEAISRGAPTAYFVERHPQAAAVIRANIAALRAQERCTVVQLPADRACQAGAVDAQTVFLDPPYDVSSPELAGLLDALLDEGLCRPDALVVVERAHRDRWVWPRGVEPLRERRYGAAHLWYGLAL